MNKGRDPGPAAVAAAAAAAASTRAGFPLAKNLNAGVTCISFSFYRTRLYLLVLIFCFLVICRRYFVCAYS